MSDGYGRDECMQFLQEAILKAKRERLATVDRLESELEHVVRIEFREFQGRTLREAMKYKVEDTVSEGEVDDLLEQQEGPGVCEETAYLNDSAYRKTHSPLHENKTVRNGSTTAILTPPGSARSAPATCSKSGIHAHNLEREQNDNRNIKHDSFLPEHPVSGRASKSCPLGPPKVICDKNARISRSGRKSEKSMSRHVPCTNAESGSRDIKSTSVDRITSRLTKIVQESGGVDEKKSEVIVHRVLHHIYENFHPDMPSKIESVLKLLQVASLPTSIPSDETQKFQETLAYLSSLRSRTSDDERLEDESVILDRLEFVQENLFTFRSKSKTLEHLLSHDNFNSIHGLVSLYKYEKRVSIKNKLLEVLSMVSTLNKNARSILLRSTLPIEIVREMYGNEENAQKLSALASPLIVLLAAGETMPHTHYDYLGSKFISFLLNYMEEPVVVESEVEERAKKNFMSLILAYNLQFTPKEENLVIRSVAAVGRKPGGRFVEALMYLFGKEVDPIASGGGDLESVPHSVFKLMRDMFSSKMTAEHFHPAEMKELIDSLVRSLGDLGPGDTRRTEHLELVWLVLRNRSFQYRIGDIQDILVTILLEEDPLSLSDQRIVKGISKEFPSIMRKGSVQIGTRNSLGGRTRDSLIEPTNAF
jgi:hypothetical protein